VPEIGISDFNGLNNFDVIEGPFCFQTKRQTKHTQLKVFSFKNTHETASKISILYAFQLKHFENTIHSKELNLKIVCI